MITKYIKGDLLKTELSNIAHGVNCRGAMGSGVAKAILDVYPQVKEDYKRYYYFVTDLQNEEALLGSVQAVALPDGKTVHNCFTQFNFGYDGEKYLSYEAVLSCFKKLKERAICNGMTQIAIPKIGCGLAGGSWEIVEALINEATGEELEVWVYEL